MEKSDEQEFTELAAKGASERALRPRSSLAAKAVHEDEAPSDPSKEEKKPHDLCQYTFYGNGYKAVARTTPRLPAGCYDIESNNQGVFVVPALPSTGLLLELPEMRSEDILKMVQRFWDSEKDYKLGNDFVVGGAAFKAGIMIFGPPGSGKSCTIKLVSKHLVEAGGVVFYASNSPTVITNFLTEFTQVEGDRKCIVILEDIDSLIERFGEAGYLEMLDSARSIDNVLFIATTNYPHKLDPRIYNRPGRFSHVMKVGLPTPEARRAYLKAILKNHRDVEEIVAATADFTIDHLTALVNSTYREGKELKSELLRLKRLFVAPKVDEGKGGIGFGS
jgi:Cdc6-like AAA superfamily ATPase